MNINKVLMSRNIEIVEKVVEAILKKLQLDTPRPEFADVIKLLIGNQLLLAHLRAIGACHVGNESGTAAL